VQRTTFCRIEPTSAPLWLAKPIGAYASIKVLCAMLVTLTARRNLVLRNEGDELEIVCDARDTNSATQSCPT
jgi:hypothetical protein